MKLQISMEEYSRNILENPGRRKSYSEMLAKQITSFSNFSIYN
jgi:hypothetical protein